MAQGDTAGRDQTPRSPSEPIREVLSSLGTGAEEKVKGFVSASRAKLDEIKKKSLEDLYADTKTFVRDNPTKTLLGALAAGFVLGRLFRRR